mgnify:CR=1 FL=1
MLRFGKLDGVSDVRGVHLPSSKIKNAESVLAFCVLMRYIGFILGFSSSLFGLNLYGR